MSQSLANPPDEDHLIIDHGQQEVQLNDQILRQILSKKSQMVQVSLFHRKWEVGPDYKFSICAISSMAIVAISVMIVQRMFEVSNNLFVLSVVVSAVQLGTYVGVLISDPGIVRQTVSEQKSHDNKYCSSCQILVNKRTYHCGICNVCIQQLDHHCPWTSKCIGKNNVMRFYLFVGWTILFIMFNTVAIPLALIDK